MEGVKPFSVRGLAAMVLNVRSFAICRRQKKSMMSSRARTSVLILNLTVALIRVSVKMARVAKPNWSKISRFTEIFH